MASRECDEAGDAAAVRGAEQSAHASSPGRSDCLSADPSPGGHRMKTINNINAYRTLEDNRKHK